MKKFYKILIILTITTTGLYLLLNIKATTKYGINYKVYTKKIPFYIKLIEYIDRYYHYKEIIKEIVTPQMTNYQKTKAILEYIQKNLHHQPPNLPVIDDHPYHILLRHYGTQDQFEDIFTILCNFADIPAFYLRQKITLDSLTINYISFVKVNKKWTIISAYYNKTFENNKKFIEFDSLKEKYQSLNNIKINFNNNNLFKRYESQNIFKRFF